MAPCFPVSNKRTKNATALLKEGGTRDSGEDREIHLYKRRQTKEDASCGAGESNGEGLKAVRGEGFLSSVGVAFVTSGL